MGLLPLTTLSLLEGDHWRSVLLKLSTDYSQQSCRDSLLFFLELLSHNLTHAQAAQKDQGAEKADVLFETYKDPSEDFIGPEGEFCYDHA